MKARLQNRESGRRTRVLTRRRVTAMWSLGLVAAVVLASAALPLTSGGIGGVAQAAPPAGTAADDAAAAQLQRDYAVSHDEAVARVGRQAAEAALVAQIAAAVPSFGGAWIDQGDGGVLTVGLTRSADGADVHRRAQQAGLDGVLRVVGVSRSAGELQQAQARLTTDFLAAGGDATRAMTTYVDLVHNSLTLTYPASGRSAAQDAFIARTSARYGASVTLVPTDEVPTTSSCSVNGCNAPLRAGVHMYTASFNCTGGFTALDGNGVNRLITAGHCIKKYGAGSWMQNDEPGTPRTIGPGYLYTYGGGGDFGIATINDPSSAGWNPRGWALVTASTGPPATTYDASYYISGEGSYATVPGSYLCHTGWALGGTACGALAGSGISVTYQDGVTVGGLARFNATTCPGDSGGPVYISHTAFGIVSGTNVTSGCGSATYYQGIGGILSAYNMVLRHN